jgi:hypothetical protein
VHALFDDMSKLVDRVEATRDAAIDRADALKADPRAEPLATKLRAIASALDEQRRKIVATKEGGAITGEERIREHTDQLYGALDDYEGRPAKYLLERIDVLKRELAEIAKDVDVVIVKEVRPLDEQLRQKQLAPLPTIGAIVPKPDARDARCLATRGRQCDDDRDLAARRREHE